MQKQQPVGAPVPQSAQAKVIILVMLCLDCTIWLYSVLDKYWARESSSWQLHPQAGKVRC